MKRGERKGGNRPASAFGPSQNQLTQRHEPTKTTLWGEPRMSHRGLRPEPKCVQENNLVASFSSPCSPCPPWFPTSSSFFTTEGTEAPARPSAATKSLFLYLPRRSRRTRRRSECPSDGTTQDQVRQVLSIRLSGSVSVVSVPSVVQNRFLPRRTGRGHWPRPEFARENKIWTSSGTEKREDPARPVAGIRIGARE